MKKLLLIPLLVILCTFSISHKVFAYDYYWDDPNSPENLKSELDKIKQQQDSLNSSLNLQNTQLQNQISNQNLFNQWNQDSQQLSQHLQNVESLNQQAENQILSLKSKYGDVYNSCYSGVADKLKSCLSDEYAISCQLFYLNSCISSDNGCKNKYGSNYQYNVATNMCDPIKTNNQICSSKYGSNVGFKNIDTTDNSIVCDCKNGYEWNSDRTSCDSIPPTITPVPPVKEISTNIITTKESAPTCNLSFNPKVIQLGQTFHPSWKITGPISKVIYKNTGVLDYMSSFTSYVGGTGASDIEVWGGVNGGYKDDINFLLMPSSIGYGSENMTVIGPGGSNSCTATIQVVSVNDSVNIPTSATPTPKVGWFQRFLNWFK